MVRSIRIWIDFQSYSGPASRITRNICLLVVLRLWTPNFLLVILYSSCSVTKLGAFLPVLLPLDHITLNTEAYQIFWAGKSSLHTLTHKNMNSQAWFPKRNNYGLWNMNRLKFVVHICSSSSVIGGRDKERQGLWNLHSTCIIAWLTAFTNKTTLPNWHWHCLASSESAHIADIPFQKSLIHWALCRPRGNQSSIVLCNIIWMQQNWK